MSAKWRSSKTMHHRRRRGDAARRRCARPRTAASEPIAAPRRRAGPAAPARSSARSSASGDVLARPSPRPSRGSSPRRRVSSRPARPRTISPSAQNVMPVAVGRAAAGVPPDVSRPGRRCTSGTPRRGGVLPMPAGPDDADTSRDAALALGGVEQVLEQAQLLVAPDERRLERLAPVAPAALGDDAHRPPRRHRRLPCP